MPRPKIKRFLNFNPNVYYFKPQGIPLKLLDEVIINRDELEAIKLHDIDNLDQLEASKKMQVSQPTFARILDNAYKKIADAIITGKAIRIEK
ncbi:DUF134 domain-containing protein [Candidatus Beckwithbacteria bacterium]|nr:DUF134 domain-containing protein [Candidatus Beckwithbacteria bacterium]